MNSSKVLLKTKIKWFRIQRFQDRKIAKEEEYHHLMLTVSTAHGWKGQAKGMQIHKSKRLLANEAQDQNQTRKRLLKMVAHNLKNQKD